LPLAWALAGGADVAAILASPPGKASGRVEGGPPPRVRLLAGGGGRGCCGRGAGGGGRKTTGDRKEAEAEAEEAEKAGSGMEFGSSAGSPAVFICWNISLQTCRRAPGGNMQITPIPL
jgi:hypothetical protein